MILLRSPRQRISRILFTSEGRGLAAAGQLGAYRFASIASGVKPQRLGDSETWGLAIVDDTVVVSQSRTGVLAYEPDGSSRQLTGFPHCWLAASPDASLLAVLAIFPGVLFVQSSAAGAEPLWTIPDWRTTYGTGPLFAPDSSRLIVPRLRAGEPTPFTLEQLDPQTGETIQVNAIPRYVSTPLAVSPCGEQIAYSSENCLVVTNLTDQKSTPAVIPSDGRKYFTDVAFHPSGRYLAATSNDATVKLYDTATLALSRTFTWEIGRLRSIAFSPDGLLAAAGSDTGRIVVWDVDC